MAKKLFWTAGLGLGMAAVALGFAVSANQPVEARASEESVTYTFTSKAWADSTSSWTSTKDGGSLQSGQGVQVTTTYSGAGAVSKNAYNNITKVVFTYCTNSSKGIGSIALTVGDNDAVSKNVTKTGGTTARALEFNFDSAVSGNVSFVVTCTQNSIYVAAVTIYTTTGDTIASNLILSDNALTIDGGNAVFTKDAELLYEVEYADEAGSGKVNVTITKDEASTNGLVYSDDEAGTITLTAKMNGEYVVTIATCDPDADGNPISIDVPVTVSNLLVPDYPEKLLDAATLSIGDTLYFVNETGSFAAGALYDGDNDYLAGKDVVIEDHKIVDAGDAYAFTLGRDGEYFTFRHGDDFLGATAIKNLSFTSGETKWVIELDDEGVCSIPSANENYGAIYTNNSAPRFMNYAGTSAAVTGFSLYVVHATDKQVAAEFETYYLVMGSEAEGQCHDLYDNAASTFDTLTAEQKAEISDDAMARLAAWAAANGDVLDLDSMTIAYGVKTVGGVASVNGSTIVVTVAVLAVGLACATALFFSRKKKQN